jgi:DNA-binding CsgD family transcriptional regulator
MLDYNNNNFKAQKLSGIYESLRFLAIDNNNDIWASHPYRGVYKISISSDAMSFSNILFTEKEGLPSTFRNNVFKIKNRIVFATEKGVYEYEKATNRFIKSALLFDIFGNIPIQYLSEDEEGNIWFCTGKKIAVASYSKTNNSYKINYFPELTGKILSGFENIYAYNNENIFVASKNGILHINYKKYIEKNAPLKVLLSQVRTFGKVDSTIFDGYFTSTNDTTYLQNKNAILQFPISNNSFHFEFSATAYNLKDNIEYSYQLVGYENNWQSWTSKTEKDYTNLPSGTYTFKIKAHDNLGNESETIGYQFVIKTAWYKTIVAYLFYLVALLFGIYQVLKWQRKKFYLQQLIHEEEQKKLKYIHQLEMEKNEKEILELQNEKLVNEVIYKNKELVDVSMHLVERSDALVKVKDELQQLYKKTGGNHDVKKAIQMVIDIEKTNSNWEQFASHFDEVNNDFLKKLKSKFPHLTNKDLKVCAYLQLNLASKEIAQLMNITVRGVELNRYRLRKKLDIPTEVNLFDFLNNISKADQ